jgi:outer membrane protein with beta-barrel domain
MRRALFVLAFLVPAALLAQPGQFELTPTAGYRLAGDFNTRSNDAFDSRLKVKVDESAVFGLTFDIPLSPYWQLELLANRQRTEFSTDDGLLSPSDKLGDVDLTFVHAGFLLQWGGGQVSPFLTASAGVTHIEPRFNDLDADNRFSASLGGGVKVFVNQNLGFRFEGRGYWTDLDTDFHNDGRRRDDRRDGLYQGEASVGLILAF